MALTKRTRFEILRRDNHTCRYCGASAPDATLTVDHVTPVALGGTDDPSNLVTACRDCNADVAQDAIRWAAAIRLAAGRAQMRQALVDTYMGAFMDEFEGYYGSAFAKDDIYRPVLPATWEESVISIYRRGLPVQLMVKDGD